MATLALGIGANTAIFSVVDSVLLRDLPYDEPDALVSVWLDLTAREGRQGPENEWFTPPDFQDFRAEPRLFEEMGAWGDFAPTLTGLDEPAVLTAAQVTPGTFERVLRVQPFLGRGFLEEEARPGAAGTVVLSHAFWQEHLGGNAAALGRTVVLDEEPYLVVGVMPAGFRPPFVPDADLWTPMQLDPSSCGRSCYVIRTIARLAPDVSLDVARQRASALAVRLAEAYPDDNAQKGVSIFRLHDDLVRPAARALWILFGAVGFVLLIACTNVANLLLVRGASREGELNLRVALGATRGPILVQLLTESLVLAATGGILGVGVASWGTAWLLSAVPDVALPGLDRVGMDTTVLAFTAAVTLGTGVLFGFFPAMRLSSSDAYERVKGAGGRSRGFAPRLRRALVVTQVALALVLLVGAGLLVRSFQRLSTADLGFQPDGVLTVGLALPGGRYQDPSSRAGYYDALITRMRGLPGVLAVGATSSLPFAGNDADADFRIQNQPPPDPAQPNAAWYRPITRGYFYAMGIEMLEGRDFEDGDDAQAPPVLIVNETLARRYFDYPRRTPVGQRVAFGGGPSPTWRTVVGVVHDTRHFSIRDGTRPALYFPYGQVSPLGMTLVLRTDGDPVQLASDARAAVSEVDPALAAASVAPLRDLIEQVLGPDRFVAGLLGLFAVVALALAAVGLYGVVSYSVSQRMREMGIRLAVGAVGADIRRLVVRGGLGMTAMGVAVGVVGALWLTGVLDTLLYEVPVTDPVTFVATTLVLVAVALLASWIPALRAGRADPVDVLRGE